MVVRYSVEDGVDEDDDASKVTRRRSMERQQRSGAGSQCEKKWSNKLVSRLLRNLRIHVYVRHHHHHHQLLLLILITSRSYALRVWLMALSLYGWGRLLGS